MKKNNLILIASTIFLFASCKDIEKETIANYCNTVNKAVTNTTYDYSNINVIEQKTYKSLVLDNKSLAENKEFISGFNDNKEIKDLRTKIDQKIEENVQTILKKYVFVTGVDNYWQVRKLSFDGKMETFIVIQIDLRGSYEKKRETKEYTVNPEKNGKTYVKIKESDGETSIFEFGKNKQGNFYLSSSSTIYWANK
jgi:hypothetical protein